MVRLRPKGNICEVGHIFGYMKLALTGYRIFTVARARRPIFLGIAADASLEEAKAAWKALARTHHPDQLIAAGMPKFISAATDRLAQINHAYQTLAGQIRARTA